MNHLQNYINIILGRSIKYPRATCNIEIHISGHKHIYFTGYGREIIQDKNT